MKLTIDQMEDALEGEVLCREEEGGKHSCTWVDVVVEFEGRLWRIAYSFDYNEGRDRDTMEAFEVEPYEEVVTKYRDVK